MIAMNNYTVLSWDVGIKNLAYCIIDKENDKFSIKDWNIINFSEENVMCECPIKQNKACSSKAKFNISHKDNKKWLQNNDGLCFNVCDKHKQKYDPVFTPIVTCQQKTPPQILKCNVPKCDTDANYIIDNTEYCWCSKHYEAEKTKFIGKIKIKKIITVSCTRQNMQQLTLNLFNELDKRPQLLQVSEVLIENQPTLKNPTMKTISTLLYAYFVLRGIKNAQEPAVMKIVRYTSPSNKLKVDIENTNTVIDNKKTDNYKLTKSLGIKYTKVLIDNEKLTFLNTFKKKDDLCDSFLQGFQYLFNPVPVEYATKLKTIKN